MGVGTTPPRRPTEVRRAAEPPRSGWVRSTTRVPLDGRQVHHESVAVVSRLGLEVADLAEHESVHLDILEQHEAVIGRRARRSSNKGRLSLQDAPGYPNAMTVEDFGRVLDRLAASFT